LQAGRTMEEAEAEKSQRQRQPGHPYGGGFRL
jgi:hypothetical protein